MCFYVANHLLFPSATSPTAFGRRVHVTWRELAKGGKPDSRSDPLRQRRLTLQPMHQLHLRPLRHRPLLRTQPLLRHRPLLSTATTLACSATTLKSGRQTLAAINRTATRPRLGQGALASAMLTPPARVSPTAPNGRGASRCNTAWVRTSASGLTLLGPSKRRQTCHRGPSARPLHLRPTRPLLRPRPLPRRQHVRRRLRQHLRQHLRRPRPRPLLQPLPRLRPHQRLSDRSPAPMLVPNG